MRIREKFAWAAAATLALFVAAAMAGVVSSGPLDPPGPISSTMKTLDEIPGSWSRSLVTSGTDPCETQRFRCVLNDQAVLDHETGLVWQREQFLSAAKWSTAAEACQAAGTGHRRGWRLPSLDELQTLMDSSTATGLPANHPFAANPSWLTFWTGTQSNAAAGDVYVLAFESGAVTSLNRSSFSHRWCVRGASHASVASDVEAPLSPWSQRLSTSAGIIDPCNSQRFQCVLEDDSAVLDRETGLVWQRVVSAQITDWYDARFGCFIATTGDRRGWRLPTFDELTSLVGSAGLPPNHPFSFGHNFWHWSSTTYPQNTAHALVIHPGNGQLANFTKDYDFVARWCVRGGNGHATHQ